MKLRRSKTRTEVRAGHGRYKLYRIFLLRCAKHQDGILWGILSTKCYTYEGTSKIFRTGAAIYAAVVVARSTGMLGLPCLVSQCAKLHVAGWTWAVFTLVYLLFLWFLHRQSGIFQANVGAKQSTLFNVDSLFVRIPLLSSSFCGPAVSRLMYCSLPRLIVQPRFSFPLSSPEALHVRWRDRPLSAKGGTMGEKWRINLA
jgi:hypothetical protein